MTSERCGYTWNGAELADVGETCCWRPTWEGRPRCVWHANERDKPRATLESLRPEPGERLDGAVIRGTALAGVEWFRDCRLVGADFTGAVLRGADFTDADVRRASFRDADLADATFVRADLERATFRNADLRSTDLTDARFYRALFTDAVVDNETVFGATTMYEREANSRLHSGSLEEVGDAVVWSYRTLQRLFDANALHHQRDRYYLKEHDARRRIAWRRREYLLALRQEGSRWVMRYGTSPWRVLTTQAVVVLACALLFPLTGGIQETGVNHAVTYSVRNPSTAPWYWIFQVLFKSLYFSVITFATLGYGDIQPVGAWARMLAGGESLVGALLMALLVFVLTRSVR
ncbi:MAG: pentapeptide repeat-containing protein [Salinigranum sp.]